MPRGNASDTYFCETQSGVVFTSSLQLLPDFWELELASEAQQQRLANVMQRQREFVRTLGMLPVETFIELRIQTNPIRHDPVHFQYVVKVSSTDCQQAQAIWRIFHTAFPSDLDYRLEPIELKPDELELQLNLLGQQPRHYYEWHPYPGVLALLDGLHPLVRPLDYRLTKGIQLLRLLAQLPEPVILGFAVQTIVPNPDDDEHSNRIHQAEAFWQARLQQIETVLALSGSPGGAEEIRHRLGEPVEELLKRKILSPIGENDLWNIVLREWEQSELAFPPAHVMDEARTTALRCLQADNYFLWRVHAATHQPLSAEIQNAVADELGRNSVGRFYQRYACVEITKDLEARQNFTDLNLRGWQPWQHDDQGYFVPRGEYIDDESATAILALPILPLGGIPGIRSYPANPFSAWQLIGSNLDHPQGSEIVIGEYIDRRASFINPKSKGVTIYLKDLTRHALVTGSTGAGKSTTCKKILIELTKQKIPFLVIEPVKNEYGDLAFEPAFIHRTDLDYYRLGNVSNHLWFNPFYIPPGISLDTHLGYLQSAFLAAFPLDDWQAMVLKRIMRAAYARKAARQLKLSDQQKQRQYGFTVKTIKRTIKKQDGQEMEVESLEIENSIVPVPNVLKDEDFPILADVIGVAQSIIDELGYRGDVKYTLEGATKLRFEFLRDGIIGALLTPQTRSQSFERQLPDLLLRPMVLNLELVADKDQKALLMAFVLTALYEHYSQQPSNDILRHITLVEEAHVLLENVARKEKEFGTNARAKAIELFVDMLAEVRSRGEGFIIAEQLPSKLIPEAIKNTNLKIMHRLTAQEDREVLGAAMNLNDRQSRFATTLEQGQAIIFREGLTEPALVKIYLGVMNSLERAQITSQIARMQVDDKPKRLWPKAIVDVLPDNQKLIKAVKDYLRAKLGCEVSDYGMLWFLRMMYQDAPRQVPYGILKQLIMQSKID